MPKTGKLDTRESNRLYERYVKPLEPEHCDEYVAVSGDGRIVVGKTLFEAVEQATAVLGPRNVVFKVGSRAVGKWLTVSPR
jgi:hypothetical protein